MSIGEHESRYFEELVVRLHSVYFLKELSYLDPAFEVLLVALRGDAVREMRLDFNGWKVGDALLAEE